ncbi:MAG TPA: sugar ABC transporter permease [Anaeromyxobacter sp.]|nr:sugar ABC transporter permease [Anaeromyxobacter sp.]
MPGATDKRPRGARAAREKVVPGTGRAILFLLAPFSFFFLVFLIYPTLNVVYLSFTNSDIAGVGKLIGAANYLKLFRDRYFWDSLWHTFYFVILTVVPMTALGLVFALLLFRLRKRTKSIAQILIFLPYILPVSVVYRIWQWMLDTNYGIVNHLLNLNVDWFHDVTWAMPAVAFVTIWWGVGFNVLLFVAGLEAIPREYYEAATLDGMKGPLDSFRYITWPLLWPVTSVVLILQLILQLQILTQPYLMTQGGPFNKTRVALQYMYVQAFQQNHGGYGATIAVAVFVVILLASALQLKVIRLGGEP